MKQTVRKTRVQSSKKFETSEFKMKVNPLMMDILSNKTYSNKKRAVLREICCNAADIHKQIGKENVPFEVQLPCDLDLTLRVRDFGTGLSHDQMQELYTTYGASTKQDDNFLTGGFGIGSKSPFAYTDMFSVTSYYKGKKYMYTCSKSATGMPELVLMNTEKTKEPAGLEVSFQVKAADVEGFQQEAVAVLKPFATKPTIINATLDLSDAETLLSGSNWVIFKSGDQYGNKAAPILRMANVDYPIPTDAIKSSKFDLFRSQSMVITVPNGTFLPTPSRESLDMNDAALKKMDGFVANILSEIQDSVNREVNQAKTLYEARSILLQLTSDNNPLAHFAKNVKWEFQGRKIEKLVPIPDCFMEHNKANDEVYAGVVVAFKQEALKDNKVKCNIIRFNEISKAQLDTKEFRNIIPVLRDVTKTTEKYVAGHIKNFRTDKEFFLVVSFDPADTKMATEFTKFCDVLGIPETEFLKAEDLTPAPKGQEAR